MAIFIQHFLLDFFLLLFTLFSYNLTPQKKQNRNTKVLHITIFGLNALLFHWRMVKIHTGGIEGTERLQNNPLLFLCIETTNCTKTKRLYFIQIQTYIIWLVSNKTAIWTQPSKTRSKNQQGLVSRGPADPGWKARWLPPDTVPNLQWWHHPQPTHSPAPPSQHPCFQINHLLQQHVRSQYKQSLTIM